MTQPYSEKSIQDIHTILSICEKYKLHPNTLFDQGIGTGSIVLPLENRLSTFGVDISVDAVTHVKNLAIHPENFFVSDSRKFTLASDLVINWHTSFSFFLNDQDNEEVLFAAFNSLNKNGLFILELYNREFTLSHFKNTFQQAFKHNGKPFLLNRVSTFNKDTNVLSSTFSFNLEPSWKKEQSIILYSKEQIISMAENVGLKLITYCNHKLQPLSPEDPRIIYIFTK